MHNWRKTLGRTAAASLWFTLGAAPGLAADATTTAAPPTADQQSNAKSDVELTRQIRKALTSDSALSTSAQNVKIITRQGDVVLKGPVRSAAEKRAVEAAANRVAGKSRVTSELEVAPQ